MLCFSTTGKNSLNNWENVVLKLNVAKLVVVMQAC